MITDFVELQKSGKALPDIIQELSSKYNYDLYSAVEQGKTVEDVVKDLIEYKPEVKGILAPVKALALGFGKGLTVETPEILGKAMQALPVTEPIGKALTEFAQTQREKFEAYAPEAKGIWGILEEGASMYMPSTKIAMGMGLAGGTIGKLLGKEAIKAGTKTALVGAPAVFGLAQARQAYEEATAQNLPDVNAYLNAVIQGTIEGFGEYYGTKYLAKLFGIGEDKVNKIADSVLSKLGIKADSLKRGLETLTVEAGTEVAQQFFEELTSNLTGASNRPITDIVIDSLSVIPPTVVMTALVGAVSMRRPKESPAREEERPDTGMQKEIPAITGERGATPVSGRREALPIGYTPQLEYQSVTETTKSRAEERPPEAQEPIPLPYIEEQVKPEESPQPQEDISQKIKEINSTLSRLNRKKTLTEEDMTVAINTIESNLDFIGSAKKETKERARRLLNKIEQINQDEDIKNKIDELSVRLFEKPAISEKPAEETPAGALTEEPAILKTETPLTESGVIAEQPKEIISRRPVSETLPEFKHGDIIELPDGNKYVLMEGKEHLVIYPWLEKENRPQYGYGRLVKSESMLAGGRKVGEMPPKATSISEVAKYMQNEEIPESLKDKVIDSVNLIGQTIEKLEEFKKLMQTSDETILTAKGIQNILSRYTHDPKYIKTGGLTLEDIKKIDEDTYNIINNSAKIFGIKSLNLSDSIQSVSDKINNFLKESTSAIDKEIAQYSNMINLLTDVIRLKLNRESGADPVDGLVNTVAKREEFIDILQKIENRHPNPQIIEAIKSIREYNENIVDSLRSIFYDLPAALAKSISKETELPYIYLKDKSILVHDNNYAIIQEMGKPPVLVRIPEQAKQLLIKLAKVDLPDMGVEEENLSQELKETISQVENLLKKAIPVKKDIGRILRNMGLESKFSQFFTGTAQEKLEEALSIAMPSKASKKDIKSVLKEFDLETEGTEKETPQKVAIEEVGKELSPEAERGEAKSIKATKSQKKKQRIKIGQRPTIEDVLKDFSFSIYATDTGLKDWLKTNPITNPNKTAVAKRLESYINRILGENVYIEIADPEYISFQLESLGLTPERARQILMLHHNKVPQEETLADIIKNHVTGVSFTPKSLSGIVFINQNLSNKELLRTGFHEIMEVLLKANYLSAEDKAVLEKEFSGKERTWTEEAADAFADYMLYQEAYEDKPYKGIFNSIRNFLTRLRNWIEGNGFRSAQDIFNAIEHGKYKKTLETFENVFKNQAPSDRFSFSITRETIENADIKEGLHDILTSLYNGIKNTFKDPKLSKLEKWLLPPQWHKNPIVKTIYSIIEQADESSWEEIHRMADPLIPELKNLKKSNKKEYNKLKKAVIDSDKTNTVFKDKDLASKYGLSKEGIRLYRELKHVYDNAIDKWVTEHERLFILASATISGVNKANAEKILIDVTQKGLLDRITYRNEETGKLELDNDSLMAYIQEFEEGQRDSVYALINDIYKELKAIEHTKEGYKVGFYFPRIWPNGSYAIYVSVMDEKTNTLTPVWRAQTRPSISKAWENIEKDKIINNLKKTLSGKAKVVTAKTPEELEEIKYKIDKDTVVIHTVELQKPSASIYEGVNYKALKSFLDFVIMKKLNSEDITEEQKNVLKQVINSIKATMDETLKALSYARARTIRRKTGHISIEALLEGTEDIIGGYETDILDVTRDYIININRSIARTKAMADIDSFLNDPEVKGSILEDSQLNEFIKRYTEAVLSPDDYLLRYVRALRTLGATWFLGGRISSAFIQLTQIYSTANQELAVFIDASKEDLLLYRGKERPLTEVGAHLQRQILASKYLTEAIKDIASGNLTQEEKEALHNGLLKGLTTSQFINSLMEESDRVLGRTFTSLATKSMFFFQKAEEFSRKVGIIAGYRLARQKGLTPEEAQAFAFNFNREAFHIYKNINKPLIAIGKNGIAPLVSLPLTLRGFMVNYLGWIYKSLNNQYGKKYVDKALFSSIYMMLLGGAWAIPLIGEFVELVGKWLGIPVRYKVKKAIEKNSETLGEILDFGLLAPLLGIDISNSIRIELLPRDFSSTGFADYIFGIWSSMGTKFTRGYYALETKQYERLLESIAPSSIESLIRGIEFYFYPMRSLTGKKIKTPEGKEVKFSTWEAILAGLGFRPVALSDTQSIYIATTTIDRYYERKRNKLYTRLKTAKSYDELSNIMKDINEYNQSVVKYGGAIPLIKPDSILNTMKQAEKSPLKLLHYID